MDLEAFNNDLNLLASMANLEIEDSKCQLNHGIAFDDNPRAVDYLCQNLGNREFNLIDAELRIPICEECVEALTSDDWLLFYCIRCNNSQWLYKPKAKNKYKSGLHVVWLDICPKCATKDEIHDMELKNSST
ncbi:MAG: hypothetical protein WCQ65_10565 [Fermentimonas sp.]